MSSTTAIGALILVPIVIAASAAFIALKTTEVYKRTCRFCHKSSLPWLTKRKSRGRRARRKGQSHLQSTQLYADSWCDLNSLRSGSAHSVFIGQSRKQVHNSNVEDEELALEKSIWHPTRSARLLWSFSNPRSRSRNHFESSSVVRPLPVARIPERLSAEDASLLGRQMRVEEVPLGASFRS